MRRLTALGCAALLSFLITLYGQGIWGALVGLNLKTSPFLPWCAPLMALLLWAMWQYLGGRWSPRRNAETRRRLLRANAVSSPVLAWSLAAGASAIAALAGLWIVLSQLVKMPPNLLPSLHGVPLATIVVLLITSSLAAPFTEEAAFRGYAQGILERHFRPAAAVTISSLLFALVHAPTQGFFWPKLLVYFLAGLLFGAVAWFADSIYASIPVHILGDITFFTCVWPYDASRTLVTSGGAGAWFWIHVAQVAVFGAVSLLAFRKLAGAAKKAPADVPRLRTINAVA